MMLLPVCAFAPDAAAGGCAEATAFLARTSGLDATHVAAYTTLICGLVTDGVWPKLDALYVLATQNTTTARLNLVSTSFGLTANGSPSFTADQGYIGVSNSATVFLDTGFVPTSAGGLFLVNSAHISFWSLTDSMANLKAMGANDAGNTNEALIYPEYTNGNSYGSMNDNSDGSVGGAVADSLGHYVCARSAFGAEALYKNGASIASSATGSQGLSANSIHLLGQNDNGTNSGGPWRIATASIGENLTSGDVLALFTREQTYLQAVGAI